MKFCIVNFNTQKLTDATIQSVNKWHNDAEITVFGNSDKEPFVNTFDNVKVIDNTKGQIINFDEVLSRHELIDNTGNNFGSFKHCLTIDKCIEIMDGNFILLDSDVLLKGKVDIINNENFCTVAEIWPPFNEWRGRVVPFICFINKKMCEEHGVHFCDENLMWGVKHDFPYYDTGSYFLEDIMKKKLPIGGIKFQNFIVHYGAGSYRDYAEKTGGYKHLDVDDWLKMYECLYK